MSNTKIFQLYVKDNNNNYEAVGTIFAGNRATLMHEGIVYECIPINSQGNTPQVNSNPQVNSIEQMPTANPTDFSLPKESNKTNKIEPQHPWMASTEVIPESVPVSSGGTYTVSGDGTRVKGMVLNKWIPEQE